MVHWTKVQLHFAEDLVLNFERCLQICLEGRSGGSAEKIGEFPASKRFFRAFSQLASPIQPFRRTVFGYGSPPPEAVDGICHLELEPRTGMWRGDSFQVQQYRRPS
jgi:hypothetical protein